MARLILGIGGAIVGTAIGIGPSAGWIIGTTIGTLLFPPAGTTAEGPRLGDLSVTSSAYGAVIQKSFGTIRMGGNIIWSEGIEEVKSTDKVGGKGGATNTAISYEYFATFAIAFGEGISEDVLRMWADGKLIYDKTGTSDEITKVGLSFRFYPGDEVQEPDSIIEADIGVNSTPAFRGMTYIVFDRFALKDFGNRIPSITAEITFNASTALNVETLDKFTVAEGGITDTHSTGLIIPDFNRRVAYFFAKSSTVGQNFIRRFQLDNMVEDRQQVYTVDASSNDIKDLNLADVADDGTLIITHGVLNRHPISIINPDSLEIVDTFGIDTISGSDFTSTQFPSIQLGTVTHCTARGSDGLKHFAIFPGSAGASEFGILSISSSSLTYVYDTETDNKIILGINVRASTHGAVGDGFGECFVLTDDVTGVNDIHLYKITIRADARFSILVGFTSGVTVELIKTFSPSDLVAGSTKTSDLNELIYDETDDTLIFEFKSSDAVPHLTKVDVDTGTQVWRSLLTIPASAGRGLSRSRLKDGVYSRVVGTTSISFRTSTGELFDTTTGWPESASANEGSLWDSRTSTYISGDAAGTIFKFLLFRGAGQGTSLSDVVSAICLRAGLLASDIDVTDLASETVPGFMIGRQTTARASIQLLSQAYFFDGVESDFKLKFTLRDGKSSTATITQKDLALLSGKSGDFFQETRIQEVELPRRFSVTYLDKDNDYTQGSQSAQRILNPVVSSQSNNEMGLQIAAAFTSDFSKQIAEKSLFSAWIERSNYKIKVGWKFLAIDPADVITINMDDGTSFRARVTQSDIGLGFAMEINSVSEDVAQYTSTIVADPGSGVPDQVFLSSTNTKLLMICSPLLRDSDDTGRTTSLVYFAMGGFGQSGWTAGTLFKSAEGTEFVDVGSIINEMSYGSASNALGDVNDPFSTDETNTLTVFMTTGGGQLSSVSQLEMVNGANPAALIHSNGIDVEIIQFRDVVLNGDGSFTLSGLLRGRRGSESFTDAHSAGNTFVLLTALNADKLPLTLSEINQTRFYAGVTSGQLFEDATIITKASPGNDLKPYAPVSQAAAPIGNDIDFTWERRTRVGGGLRDDTGTVPLNEDTESYEIDIFDTPGGSVVRTITGLSTTSTTYTDAQQTTDGFTPPLSQITIEIYQISAQVGRGFTKEVTLDVE